MRIRKRNATDERRILIAMVTNDRFLGRIHSKWKAELFKSKWSALLAHWCVDYYTEYEAAPKQHIEAIFESWERETKDEATSTLIHKLLSDLSDEYEEQGELNVDYMVDVAGKYFNRTQIETLNAEVTSHLDSNDVQDAHDALINYTRIEMGIGSGIDFFQDKEAVVEAFRNKENSLIRYGGALGQFFGVNLGRGDFVSFLGRKKIGKSFWLMDIAYRGILDRKKVAYFEVGDMGQNNTIIRLCQRAAKHPRFAGISRWPTKMRNTQKESTQVKYDDKKFTRNLNAAIATTALDAVMKKKIRSKHPYLKLSCHANSTLSVSGLISILNEWEVQGWVPDVIVIDYADILNMEYSALEGRDRINQAWKQLRQLSQERHALVVTATQADADSFVVNRLTMSNFSEDNRKLDHVTGMVGINQNNKEKRLGVTRLNWIALREGEYDPARCVYVAGCWALANPAVTSCWSEKKNSK